MRLKRSLEQLIQYQDQERRHLLLLAGVHEDIQRNLRLVTEGIRSKETACQVLHETLVEAGTRSEEWRQACVPLYREALLALEALFHPPMGQLLTGENEAKGFV